MEGLLIIDFLGEAKLAGRRPRRETDRLIWAEGELPWKEGNGDKFRN